MGPIHQQQIRPENRSGSSGSPGGSTLDQSKVLRTQIHQDIERKAKVCANSLYECSLPRVETYAYCLRHILQDPKAPYKQCGFCYPNGRRCLEPSPRYDAKKDYGTNYCFEHSRQTQLVKTKSTIGKLVPVETTETLLHSLAHHVKVDKNKQHHMGNHTPLKITVHEDDDDNDVDVVTPSVDPFVDLDVAAINDYGRIVLDYASDSTADDEEMQQPTYGSSWKGQDMENSDTESVDSQSDYPLKHAGIYTAEEATRITKEKLSRLQSLYVDQIQRLQHVLCERRRNFLKEQRIERETHCSIYDQIKETPRERLLYAKLKGLNRYHRKHGTEAILQRKYLEKRAKATEGLQQKPPSLPKCTYTEGGVKCGERTLPCCKHCRKHVLEDKKQVLFRACGIEKSGVVCQEPLAGLFENGTCPLHVELPAQRSFNKRKYESESEGEAEPVATGSSLAADNNVTPVATDAFGADTVMASFENTVPDEMDEKKNVQDSLKNESKPVVRTESKRRSTRQVVTTPYRVRNTRAARAALERQQHKRQPEAMEQKVARSVGEEKKLQASEQQQQQHSTAEIVEQNVTIVHDANDYSGTILDEEHLPTSIIARKKTNLMFEDDAKSSTTVGLMQQHQMNKTPSQAVNEVETQDAVKFKTEPSTKDSTHSTILSLSELKRECEEEAKKTDGVKIEKTVEYELNTVSDSSTVNRKEATAAEQNFAKEKLDDRKITKDGEYAKTYSSPEPSKRRRTVEARAQLKREMIKNEPVHDESKNKASDEDNENRNKHLKNKADAAEVYGTTPKGSEKSRRQHK